MQHGKKENWLEYFLNTIFTWVSCFQFNFLQFSVSSFYQRLFLKVVYLFPSCSRPMTSLQQVRMLDVFDAQNLIWWAFQSLPLHLCSWRLCAQEPHPPCPPSVWCRHHSPEEPGPLEGDSSAQPDEERCSCPCLWHLSPRPSEPEPG